MHPALWIAKTGLEAQTLIKILSNRNVACETNSNGQYHGPKMTTGCPSQT